MRPNALSRDLHEFVEEMEKKHGCEIHFITWGCDINNDGATIRNEDSRFINIEYREN